MNKIKDFFLSSSADPSKLSKTLEGIMATVVSVVALIISFHGGQPIDQGQVDIIVQNAVVLVSSIGTALGTLVTIWAILRKIFMAAK